jgi:hypothetical protein
MTPRSTDGDRSSKADKPDPRDELARARTEEARGDSGDDVSPDKDPENATGPRPGASIPEIELDLARTREEFAATLDAIEDKLSVPAHARRVKASVKRRLDTDPKPVIAAAAAGAVGVVALVAGIVKSVRR